MVVGGGENQIELNRIESDICPWEAFPHPPTPGLRDGLKYSPPLPQWQPEGLDGHFFLGPIRGSLSVYAALSPETPADYVGTERPLQQRRSGAEEQEGSGRAVVKKQLVVVTARVWR